MLLNAFLKIIKRLVPFTPSEQDIEKISQLNPDKIYVENVRSVLHVSSVIAKQFCETAVRQGLFQKRVEVVCPDGSVATSAATVDALPATVRCWQEHDGELEEAELRTDTLPKTTFYQLAAR